MYTIFFPNRESFDKSYQIVLYCVKWEVGYALYDINVGIICSGSVSGVGYQEGVAVRYWCLVCKKTYYPVRIEQTYMRNL